MARDDDRSDADGPGDDGADLADVTDLGYAAALAELETILEELERDHLDVDRLSDQVRRASQLVAVCRARIRRAQAEVDRVVADLDEFEGDEGD